MPSSPNIKGLPYHKDVPVYEFDLKKSADYMKKAWDGKVWDQGFKMIITHNTGNEMREAAANMMAENIMSLNPKFQIEVRNVEWKDYLVKYRNFHKLQDLWYTEATANTIYQQIVVRAYRDWVKGYVPNAMLTDANEMLMNIWKE
jgi:ABC-type transport system substrate-binding protein